jgi:hypothetical protein
MTITIKNGNGVSLRKITPSKEFEGFTKFGKPVHSVIMRYIQDLEPSATGYYLS